MNLLATTQYPKIQGLFKRVQEKGPDNGAFTGEFTIPEFEFLARCPWMGTEKVDGTNIRLIFDGRNLMVGGRTERAEIPQGLLDHIHSQIWWDADLWANTFSDVTPDDPVVIFGEGYGGKIQKGGATYGPRQRFVAFDIRIGKWWMTRENLVGITQGLKIPVVPIIYTGTLFDAIREVRKGIRSSWCALTEGLTVFDMEGLVLNPAIPLQRRNGERVVTKLKTKDRYTLKALELLGLEQDD